MPKHETRNTLIYSGNEIWLVYVTLKDNFFYHKILRKVWPGN